jgi:hypothetical protein
MQGSGTYIVNVDESFTSFDVVNMSVLVPMWTKRGQPYQEVTRDNFKQKVGYDLLYNSNYAGLSKLLDSISSVKVWRINKNATYGNVVFTKNGDNFSYAGITDPNSLENSIFIESENKSAASGSFTGAVAFKPKLATVKIKTPGGTVIGQSDSDGVITGTDLSGTIDADTKAVAITFGASYAVFPYSFKIEYEEDTGVAAIIYMESSGDWDTLAVKIDQNIESLTEDIFSGSGNDIDLLYPIDRATLVIKNSAGTIIATTNGSGVITGTNVTGNVDAAGKITGLAFAGSSWTYPMKITLEYKKVKKYYKVSVFSYSISLGAYTSLEDGVVNFSDPDDALFTSKVSFENIVVQGFDDFDSGVLPLGEPIRVPLENGNDGTIPGSGDLDFTKIKADDSFFVVSNGLLIASLQSRIMEWSASKNKFYLGDFPNLSTKEELKYYGTSLYATEKAMIDFRADLISVDGLSVYVYPSVFRALAFANMYRGTGYLGYPSAGYTYGAVSAENLFDFDVSDAAVRQYFKVNKINYIDDGKNGKVFWEHRTRYAFESDWSYSTTIINLIFLGARCQSFMAPFQFKFIDPEVLSKISAGLTGIVQDYISKGFVWSGKVVVPTFDQVKQSGARFMTIGIPVQFAQDAEEFILRFNVQGTAVS